MAETRRSPRVLVQVPILIAANGPLYNAVTAVVNRHGALILCPVMYDEDTEVQIQNLQTGELARARVVWLGSDEVSGMHKIGVELLDEQPEFWNVDYAAAAAAPPQPATS